MIEERWGSPKSGVWRPGRWRRKEVSGVGQELEERGKILVLKKTIGREGGRKEGNTKIKWNRASTGSPSSKG